MKILAGDFICVESSAAGDRFVFGSHKKGEAVLFSEIERMEIDMEDSETKGGLGWAAAGGLVFGGAGAITGAVLGRKTKKESVVSIVFLDGRRLMAVLPYQTLVEIRAALFDMEGKDINERREGMANRLMRDKAKQQKKIKDERLGTVLMIAILVVIALWAYPKLQRGEKLISPPSQSQQK